MLRALQRLFGRRARCSGGSVRRVGRERGCPERREPAGPRLLAAAHVIKPALHGFFKAGSCKGDSCKGGSCNEDSCKEDSCKGGSWKGDSCKGDSCKAALKYGREGPAGEYRGLDAQQLGRSWRSFNKVNCVISVFLRIFVLFTVL